MEQVPGMRRDGRGVRDRMRPGPEGSHLVHQSGGPGDEDRLKFLGELIPDSSTRS